MIDYKKTFLQLAIDAGALQFGDFRLKSGRKSPYFFDASVFFYGNILRDIAKCYCDAIKAEGLNFDSLLGVAYKGIPLATAVGTALAESGCSVPISFNRKEKKIHGEGGVFFGATPKGRVLAIDDVLTAGTAILEMIDAFYRSDASLSCVCVALDRSEISKDSMFTREMLAKSYNLAVVSIVDFDDLLSFLADSESITKSVFDSISEYRERWRI